MRLIRKPEDLFFEEVVVRFGQRGGNPEFRPDPAKASYWTAAASHSGNIATIPRDADEIIGLIRNRTDLAPLFEDRQAADALRRLIQALKEQDAGPDESAVPEFTYALI